jgi:catechol 2,3-dioxygenase
MALELGISHVVLKVRDLDEMLAFYSGVLEFDVVDRGPVNLSNRGDLGALDTEIVFLSQDPHNHHQLAMLPIRDDDHRGPVDHMAFRSGSFASVRELSQKLASLDVVVRPVSHGNTLSCYFSDPEGNGVEVYAETPFHVDQPQVRPVDLSMSDDDAAAWVQQEFADAPGFRSKEDYVQERLDQLAQRPS